MKFNVEKASATPYEEKDKAPCYGAVKFADEQYTVELHSLEELLNFLEVNGRIVLSRERFDTEPEKYSILIYDDCIE